MPAVNSVAHTELRALPELHWWTFWGYFMSIGESLLSSVINIRLKKAKGKKLEKCEQEFYRENRKIIDIKRPRSEQEERELRELLGFLDKK